MKTLEQLAQEMAGNWLSMDSFSWYSRDDNVDHNWGLYHYVNRDSDLLTQSNAVQILEIMAPYIKRGTVTEQHFNHWACGWIDALAIRVYRKDDKITRAFETFYEQVYCALEDYSVLNEDHWTELEQEAAYDNVLQALKYDINDQVDNADLLLLDDQLHYGVYHAIDGDNGSADNTDGQGFYPSEQQLITALLELGRIKECCDLAMCDCDYPYIVIENPVYPCGCSRLSYEHTCTQLCGHSYGCKCWGD